MSLHAIFWNVEIYLSCLVCSELIDSPTDGDWVASLLWSVIREVIRDAFPLYRIKMCLRGWHYMSPPSPEVTSVTCLLCFLPDLFLFICSYILLARGIELFFFSTSGETVLHTAYHCWLAFFPFKNRKSHVSIHSQFLKAYCIVFLTLTIPWFL
jgi:hypothetical protein